ncbi:MAG: mechanosensitive ion channel domain-containing protein, partial [Luteimonas sp.]
DGACRLLATTGPGQRRSLATRRALEQAAVLLSAVARLLLIFLACGALLVPFGAGFTSVFESLAALTDGFEIGGVTVSAAAVFRAALAFVVVVALVRFIRTWITRSYLPTTSLQPDARDSVDKILRYVGLLLAVLWALTAFGVGMEKVAILASALSVGIGFGLQAITQNFVSGLILLVERPVKIGDWVKLNDVEGDIRRINVRSTEIQIADHSTVIVPNSELITKVVQNKTKGNSLGRAQILLSIPLESDLDAAIDVVTGTLAADAEVLKTPAPGVFIDRIDNGMVVLNCFVHVVSPRQAYGVRSRLIRATLRALKRHDIAVTLPPQQFVLTPAPPG